MQAKLWERSSLVRTLPDEVSVTSLERAIRIWEEMIRTYKQNMLDIKSAHMFTWWLRPSYWHNEKALNKSFGGLIRRRVELQTAIKAQKENA